MICASKLKWNDNFASICSTELFGTWKYPHKFEMRSPKTGKVKQFSIDYAEAERSEYWDGEFALFCSEDKKQTIRIWGY